MKSIIFCAALALVCACSNNETDTYAAGKTTKTPAATTPASTPAPEAGTKPKPADAGMPKKVATDQSNDQADLEMVASIRRKLMDDAALSTQAKNAVVVVEEGRVTLSGKVPTEGEKERVGALAGRVAGDANVDNRLEVQP